MVDQVEAPRPAASSKGPPTWEEETKNFRKPGEPRAAVVDDKSATADKPDDDAAAAAKVGQDTAKAAAGDDTLKAGEAPADKAGKGEGGEKAAAKDGDEEIPSWLKGRLERVATKERRADETNQQHLDRIAELEEENAALKAAPKVIALPKEPVKPKSSDFDTPEEYETARDKFDTDKAVYDTAKAEAAKVPAKVEAKAAPKAAPGAPALPLGITAEDLGEAATNIRNAAGTLADAISDEKKVPTFTAAMMMHVSEQPKERTKEMVDWVIKSPKTMAAIAKLPPIKQAGAFERAFTERPTSKTVSTAPKPIERLGTGVERSNENFADFEARRNAEERAERAAGRL